MSDHLTSVPLTSKSRRSSTLPRRKTSPPRLQIVTDEKRNHLSSSASRGIMSTLPLPRSNSGLPPTPRSGETAFAVSVRPSLKFTGNACPSPTPSFLTDGSRAETPSPITFAPVQLPSTSRHPASPLQPGSPTYLPSFDPGVLEYTPQAVSPEHSPSSSSRARVSFDQNELQRGFHLPRRASVDLPQDSDPIPLRPSLELDPDYALAKVREDERQAGLMGGSVPARVAVYPPSSVHSLRWLPHQENLREEDEEEDLATTQESLPYTRDREGTSAGPMRLQLDTKNHSALEVPITARTDAPLSPASARSRMTELLASELASAIWHVVIFQICFMFIVVLAGLSTWIDLGRGRGPSAFGTQHVSLILVGWGPLIVFGHTSAVRSYIRGLFTFSWRRSTPFR
ncbi:hypothetical protein K488DRAFT_85712 [Vararia minispora EC-137]|uniref:Uncharacterized protein n=1 Tax=Vararia minispora EC-137 TaxID=1314806 RepID=A0ACB8QLS2_9AGAM|nr:hypothetical protein K488DRAFT_85712 [Vararia minispora EC-137]